MCHSPHQPVVVVAGHSKWLIGAVLAVAYTFGLRPAAATLVDVSNPENVLSPSNTVTASDGGVGVAGLNIAADIVDGYAPKGDQDASFIFNNTPTALSPNLFSVSGFDATSGVSDLRFFIAPADTNRVPTEITVYTSTSLTSSLSPSAYSNVAGTFNEPGGGWGYTAYSAGDTSENRGYFDLIVAGHVPSGTQSLLVSLDGSGGGGRVYELQALVPEPSSVVFLICGGAGILLAAHCQRNHRTATTAQPTS